MTDTPRLFIARYDNGLSPRYEVVPEGAMGAEPWVKEGAGVKVKPLEWGWDADAGCLYAGPSWLEYELYEQADGTCDLHFPGAMVGHYPHLEAAKAAAQADFEARIRAAIELTTEPEPTSGWQPIETAPKGTSILAYTLGDDGRPMIFVAWWANLAALFANIPTEIPRDADEWEWVSGWSRILQPTHWQPLPAPPGAHDGGTPTRGAYDLICCTAEDVATGRSFTGDPAADLAMAQESLRDCLKLLGWRG